MLAEILDEKGAVINRIIADKDFCDAVHPGRWREYIEPATVPDLAAEKASAVLAIKAEAERRITALDWRLQRAQEREQLGESGVETVSDVLVLREQIRQASNAAEAAVAILTTTHEVQAFTW